MKFIDALELISQKKHSSITRENWNYKIYFCLASSYLMIKGRDELTPYVISEFDFSYEWEILE